MRKTHQYLDGCESGPMRTVLIVILAFRGPKLRKRSVGAIENFAFGRDAS